MRAWKSVALGAILLATGIGIGLFADRIGFAKRHDSSQVADPLIALAKLAIGEELFDPESVRYKNIRVVNPSGTKARYVCGSVNAKNKMAGYVGFKKFAWFPVVKEGMQKLMLEGTVEGWSYWENLKAIEKVCAR